MSLLAILGIFRPLLRSASSAEIRFDFCRRLPASVKVKVTERKKEGLCVLSRGGQKKKSLPIKPVSCEDFTDRELAVSDGDDDP